MVHRNTSRPHRVQPTGLAFDLPDLLMAQAWAEFHGLRMVIELDRHADGHACEEILAFYPPRAAACRWTMWRAASGVVAQAILGRRQPFAAVAEALEQLIPASA